MSVATREHAPEPGHAEFDLGWEKRCLLRARDGDRAAFAALYEAYADRLYRRILVPRLGNAQAAEDALSETFRTLLERIHEFEPRGVSVFHWLSRIAVNKANDMHRVKGRTSRALASFESLLAPLRPSHGNPGTDVEVEEERQRLTGAVQGVLEGLNPRYRRAIELRFLEDRPRQECAEALEVKLGTFDVVLLRALRAFRREWERAMPAPWIEQES